jgi:hypothetical protein
MDENEAISEVVQPTRRRRHSKECVLDRVGQELQSDETNLIACPVCR